MPTLNRVRFKGGVRKEHWEESGDFFEGVRIEFYKF